MGKSLKKKGESQTGTPLSYSLSDPVHGSDQLLIGINSPPRHQVEDERYGRKDCRPGRTEIDSAPGLVAHRLTHDEIADIPPHDQQGIEQAEECLQLAIMIDEDGIGGYDRRRQPCQRDL